MRNPNGHSLGKTMKVLFFAHLRDLTGRAEIELDPGGTLSADELWAQLIALYPDLASSRQVARLTRNSEYATSNTRFEAGDEVAIIPPVSGG
jgi:molybdopterin converting factor subunit 1